MAAGQERLANVIRELHHCDMQLQLDNLIDV
jgi:hypothetical protein